MAQEIREHGAGAPRVLPNTYTEFQIITPYKGLDPSSGNRIFLYYQGDVSRGAGLSRYTNGSEEVIYAQRLANGAYLPTGACSGCQGDGMVLDAIAAAFTAAEGLIAAHPDIKAFYLKKSALYAEYRDFFMAARTIERYLQRDKQALADIALAQPYAEYLYAQKEYKKVLSVLTPHAGRVNADEYLQLAYIYLGEVSALRGQKLHLSGKIITGVTLDMLDAPQADFKNAVLQSVTFKNFNLKGASFEGAQLKNVVFETGDLSDAQFNGARMQVSFTNVTATEAQFKAAEVKVKSCMASSFTGADFTGAMHAIYEMEGCGFVRASFDRARIYSLEKSDYTGASFSGATFADGNFSSGRSNKGMKLSGKKLDGAAFNGSDMAGADFENAGLRDAGFRSVLLSGANFKGADLTGADFTPDKFNRAPTDLSGADFMGAKVENVKWTGAQFDCETRFPAGFKPAQAGIIAKDASCLAADDMPDIFMDSESLKVGKFPVCPVKADAACVYAFLASAAAEYLQSGNNRHGYFSWKNLAQSLIDAGYPELARLIIDREIAFIANSKKLLSIPLYSEWLPLGERVDALQDVKEPGKDKVKSVFAHTQQLNDYADAKAGFILDNIAKGYLSEAQRDIESFIKALDPHERMQRYLMAAEPLAKMFAALSAAYASKGEYEKARQYVARIGDDEFNRKTLYTPSQPTHSLESSFEYRERQREPGQGKGFRNDDSFILALTDISLARARKAVYEGGAAVYAAGDLALAERYANAFLREDNTALLAPIRILAGQTVEHKQDHRYTRNRLHRAEAEAYLLHGNEEKVWEVFAGDAEKPQMVARFDVLDILARHYARKNDTIGKQKVADLLLTAMTDPRWQKTVRDMFSGTQRDFLEESFKILAALQHPAYIQKALEIANSVEDASFQQRARYHALPAFVLSGDVTQAWALFDRAHASYHPSGDKRQGHPTQIVFLTWDKSTAESNSPWPGYGAERLLADFVLDTCFSPSAPMGVKKRALALGEKWIKDKVRMPSNFERELTVAKAVVEGHAAGSIPVKSVQYGMLGMSYIELLQRAGLRADAEAALDSMFDRAMHIGGNYAPSGTHELRYYQQVVGGGYINVVRNVISAHAGAGRSAKAEELLRGTVEHTILFAKTGTDTNIHLYRQYAYYGVAKQAAMQGNVETAVHIAENDIAHAPYRSAVYTDLAKAAADKGDIGKARFYLLKSHEASPDFPSAVGLPLQSQTEEPLLFLYSRGILEARIGEESLLKKTQSYLDEASYWSGRQFKEAMAYHTALRLRSEKRDMTAEEYAQRLLAERKKSPSSGIDKILLSHAREMLESGNGDVARNIALSMLREPPLVAGHDAAGRILKYADIIARTEKRMPDEILQKIEQKIMGSAGPWSYAGAAPEEAGAILYQQLREAAERDDKTATRIINIRDIDGNREFFTKDHGHRLMEKWVKGAVERYQYENPDKMLSADDIKKIRQHLAWHGVEEAVVAKQPISIPYHQANKKRNPVKVIMPEDVPRSSGKFPQLNIFYMSDFTCSGDVPPLCYE